MSKPTTKSTVVITKLTPNAEYPYKEGQSVIYDITAVSRTNNRAEDSSCDTNDFNTGIAFEIPRGYYLELSAHNSLYKHGYLFVGPTIIDQNATAELIITLYKFKEVDDIELPLIVARLVLKENVDMHFTGKQKKSAYQQDDDDDDRKMDKQPYNPSFGNAKPPTKKGKNSSFF